MSAEHPQWYSVRCRGGNADGTVYCSMIEPPEEIVMVPSPAGPGWTRVLPVYREGLGVTEPWPEQVIYLRARKHETYDRERIYIPKEESRGNDT